MTAVLAFAMFVSLLPITAMAKDGRTSVTSAAPDAAMKSEEAEVCE